MLNLFPRAKNKVDIIYNTYNHEFRANPKSINSECPEILHVGTAKRKNLERTIVALSGIKCVLTIVGKLSEEQSGMLKEYSIVYKNEYDITNERMAYLYEQCDIVSFPTLYEGFGVPVIEANAVGRPIITSRVTSIPEIAGDAAVFVNPYSIEDIRNGFLSIIDGRINVDLIISAGYRNVRRFDRAKIINDYIQIYREIDERI